MGDKREKDRPKLNSKIIAPPVDESHARDASDSRKRRRSSSPVPRGERNDFLRRDNFNRDGFRMNEPRRFVERRPNENNSFSTRGRDRNFSRDNNRYYRDDNNIDDSNINSSNNNNDNRSGNINAPHPADRMMGRSWRNSSDNRDNRGDFRDNRDNRDTRGGFNRGFSRGSNFNGGGRFHRGSPFRGNSGGNGGFNRRGGRGNSGSGGFDPEDDPTAFDYIVPRGKSYFQHDDRIESDEDESHMSKRGRSNEHWQPRNRNRNNARGDRWSHDKFEELDTENVDFTENTKTESASNNNGHTDQNIEISGIADDASQLEDMDHRHRDRNHGDGDSGNEEYSESRHRTEQQQNEEQKDQQQLLQKEHGHSNEGLVVDYEDAEEDRDRNHENIEDN